MPAYPEYPLRNLLRISFFSRPSIVELKERGLFPTESELNESRRRVSTEVLKKECRNTSKYQKKEKVSEVEHFDLLR